MQPPFKFSAFIMGRWCWCRPSPGIGIFMPGICMTSPVEPPEPDCWCGVPAAGGLLLDRGKPNALSTCRLTASSIFGTWVFVGQRLGYGYVADRFRSDIPEA